MDHLPCKGCKGLCCGPVPITEEEFRRIKKRVKAMPKKLKMALENQERFNGTCIFYNLEKDQCGIHSVRPDICRAFGYYKELACFRKPEVAAKQNWFPRDTPIGVLSVDYTWKDFA